MLKFASRLVGKHDSFYIANLNVLQSKIDEWKYRLPEVKPFYAVKCNPDTEMLKLMLRNDINFDCASKHEMKKALKLGARPDALGFFHPVKNARDLAFAARSGIEYMSFDNVSELDKIARAYAKAKLFLRIKIDNPSARVQLGLKYGALREETPALIDHARSLGLNIVGTAFHVGSASKDPVVFEQGISLAREIREYAQSKEYACDMLDIGGGFTKDNFVECAQVIQKNIKNHGFEKVIAEPGRYFAEQVYTFFVTIIGIRRRTERQYWIKDSLYGSFNAVIYDKQTPVFEAYRNPLFESIEDAPHEASTLMFETCDSYDKYPELVSLPANLRIGDYLIIKDFGAYTLSGACDFNGINMTRPKIFYVRDCIET